MPNNNRILTIIVLSQFAGTSLWFAGNAVIKDMASELGLASDTTSHMISAVQLGFIAGTLLFAVFTIADRFSPSRIFFTCAIAAALCNLSVLATSSLPGVLFSRIMTGFFLAGIYPVGMKIASDYHEKGLGKALGYLVSALVLGTAFPHLLNGLKADYNWRYVITGVSLFAVSGGVLVLWLVPDGPYRIKGNKVDLGLAFKLFRGKDFRSAAMGYFGHMWELYTFWALVPSILTYYLALDPAQDINVSLLSCAVIGIGSIACVVGGYISQRAGSARTAFVALLTSGICCLLSYFAFHLPFLLFIIFLLIWGMAVIADSPQFSSLIAQSVNAKERGTALTIGNAMGFAITIVSIQFINWLQQLTGIEHVFFVLAAGPLIGLIFIWKVIRRTVA